MIKYQLHVISFVIDHVSTSSNNTVKQWMVYVFILHTFWSTLKWYPNKLCCFFKFSVLEHKFEGSEGKKFY